MRHINALLKPRQDFGRSGIRAAQALVIALTVMVALFSAAQTVSADNQGNTDTAVGGCMQDMAGFGLNCTANDIEIANVTELEILDDGCAYPGDTVTFRAKFEVLLTAQARHDIGLWFAIDGDPNGDGAYTGTCLVGTPAYAPDLPWLDLDGTSDTFLNTNIVSNIQDTCGDIDDDHNPLYPVMTVTAECIAGPDGNLSLPACTSWKQPGDNDLCTGPLPEDLEGSVGDSSGVPPGAPSKCKCQPGFTVPIRVPAFIKVDKVTVDSNGNPLPNDPNKFAFIITGLDADLPDNFQLGDADPIHTSDPLDAIDQEGNPVGPYQVSETVPSGWELYSVVCTRDNATPYVKSDDVTFAYTNGADIQPLPGEVVACTFTDKKLACTLKLEKTVDNDDGGTLVVSDFPLFITGTDGSFAATSGAPVILEAGNYTASETQQSGYSASGWTGDCASDGKITLLPGDNKTCTITNEDKAAHLKLVKVVKNDNGGTAAPSDWTLSAASGPNEISGAGGVESDVDAGTYTLSEFGGSAGYTAGSWSCVGGTQSGDQITLGLGESATCTIINDDKAPGLTLLKTVINDNGGTAAPTDWTLTAVGYDPGSPDAGTYSLSESGPAGYTLKSLTCSNATGEVTSVTLGLGEDVTCTFVNDDNPPAVEPRTIGFWKNWNTCTGGNQNQTAAASGGPDAGRYLLDDLLSDPGYTIGILRLDGEDCVAAVNILDKRQIEGQKMASDAAYNLAAQLLAAKLNLSAGAETCQEAVEAVNAGQALLNSIKFDGTGNYLRPRDARYPAANQLAATLDTYNNGNLCTP